MTSCLTCWAIDASDREAQRRSAPTARSSPPGALRGVHVAAPGQGTLRLLLAPLRPRLPRPPATPPYLLRPAGDPPVSPQGADRATATRTDALRSPRYRVDSFLLPACPCARTCRGPRFRGEGAFGYGALRRQTCYGFRVHALMAWPGSSSAFVSPRSLAMRLQLRESPTPRRVDVTGPGSAGAVPESRTGSLGPGAVRSSSASGSRWIRCSVPAGTATSSSGRGPGMGSI